LRAWRFESRLIATLRAVEPILEVPGVLAAGSEVPNLLEVGAASTLVVSQDVDLATPFGILEEVKARLPRIERLVSSTDEPSVWEPRPDASELIEVKFIGTDPAIVDPMDTARRERAELDRRRRGDARVRSAGIPRPAVIAIDCRARRGWLPTTRPR